MSAGIPSLAGFDRSFRRHDVRGLIDFPFPCRTVSTQVLLYVERLVVSSDLTTISAGAELPPSCLRMASHRRLSRSSNDRCSRTRRQIVATDLVRQSRTFPETWIKRFSYQLAINSARLGGVDNSPRLSGEPPADLDTTRPDQLVTLATRGRMLRIATARVPSR